MHAIHSPLQYYLREAKQKHDEAVKEKFDELERKSGVSLTENAATVREYDAQQKKVAGADRAIRRKKRLRTIGILFAVIIVAIGLFLGSEYSPAWYACTPVAIAIVIAVCVAAHKAIATLKTERNSLAALADELYQKANGQTQPLRALFTGAEAKNLVEAVVPCISFDEKYCAERQARTAQEYGFTPVFPNGESVVETLSGELCNRPFLFDRRLVRRMGTRTYHGSLIISWTTQVRNSQGQYETRTHSETLHASITRPIPEFDYFTELLYFHEAEPELCFSRNFSHVEDKSERSLERKLRKGEKKLLKMTDDALKKGEDFVATFNTDFEILFNATNRTDEIAFRRMFPAKAQESMVRLLLSDDGYGDDFFFEKNGTLNRVCSEHSRFRPLDLRASDYFSHDATEIKQRFLALNEEFFKGLFFDFAPLMLVASYQTDYVKNVVFYGGTPTELNREEAVNRHYSLFTPIGATTPCILKTSLLEKTGEDEIVKVHAYAYTTVERTDYVSKRGGDGNFHSVPVHWTEYLPVSSETVVRISKSGETTVL